MKGKLLPVLVYWLFMALFCKYCHAFDNDGIFGEVIYSLLNCFGDVSFSERVRALDINKAANKEFWGSFMQERNRLDPDYPLRANLL